MITHEALSVPRGTTGVFSAFYRDQLDTQTSMYRNLRPNGTVFRSWNHSSPAPHLAASGWPWPWSIQNGAPTGTWTFEVTFDGQVYSKTFVVS
ncbi:MAG: hypothetical protein ACI8QZ_003110 [Chlamydiales bacterium]|jgi:uncharacterized protein YfaS (alpha-2-macroglobulin family)